MTDHQQINVTSPAKNTAAKEALFVIKIGGNIIDDSNKLESFLKDFSAIQGKKILVHGGGKLATQLARDLNVEQEMVDGRRITDAATLKIVTMVYAGYINKNIVAKLQSNGSNAMGFTGADANLILAHKRLAEASKGIDYGFVGDIDAVNTAAIEPMLAQHIAIVLAPITHNGAGQLLNTNADTIAQSIATAMSGQYNVWLLYCFEKSGVLLDASDDTTVIPTINQTYYQSLKEKQLIFAGMIPKLDNAFEALNSGVEKVIIGKAESILDLVEGKAGTTIQKS
ncbi:MAG: acetylglutamate kinase [Chitinophagaceae bacterium]|nr:acetylglutamate kinase [Chitinophagaceae bacterium]